MLHVFGIVFDSLHEFVGDTHRHVGSRYLGQVLFDRDEILHIGMGHIHGKHQGTPAAVLCHLARSVGKTLHEGHRTGGRPGGIGYDGIFGTQPGNIHPHSATAFEQLGQLLVGVEDTPIGIDHRRHHHAVGQGGNDLLVAQSRHHAPLRDDVTKTVEQLEDLLFAHLGARLPVSRKACLVLGRIFLLDPGKFPGHAMMHVGRRFFQQTTVQILERVLLRPSGCRQFISVEVLQGFFQNLLVRIRFLFFRRRARLPCRIFHHTDCFFEVRRLIEFFNGPLPKFIYGLCFAVTNAYLYLSEKREAAERKKTSVVPLGQM